MTPVGKDRTDGAGIETGEGTGERVDVGEGRRRDGLVGTLLHRNEGHSDTRGSRWIPYLTFEERRCGSRVEQRTQRDVRTQGL